MYIVVLEFVWILIDILLFGVCWMIVVMFLVLKKFGNLIGLIIVEVLNFGKGIICWNINVFDVGCFMLNGKLRSVNFFGFIFVVFCVWVRSNMILVYCVWILFD